VLRQVLRQVLRSGFESQTITDGRQVRIIYTLLYPLNNLGQFFRFALFFGVMLAQSFHSRFPRSESLTAGLSQKSAHRTIADHVAVRVGV
jgi:hypothetical protein